MSLLLEIKVVPSSGRIAWAIDRSGQIKCFLKSPPEHGKANRELIKLIAQSLGLQQGQVRIVFGETSRKKRVKIDADISQTDILRILHLDQQVCLFDIKDK
ncbi:MAG TPA: DUF167 domain-containing protein [Candidatus Dependentiae bacterium]|nr:DUF167 domain-containing protein [Candidatus Dependentiae bacterium]HRQ63228.1 DUF167 domain-containing protein [Candidatus Dependentiae bacterium]